MNRTQRVPANRRTLSVTTDGGAKQFTVVSIETKPYGDWITVTGGFLPYGSYKVTLRDGDSYRSGDWAMVVGKVDPKSYAITMSGTFRPANFDDWF